MAEIILVAALAGGLGLAAQATRGVALADLDSRHDIKDDADVLFAHTWRGARWYLFSDWAGACAVLLSAFAVVLLLRAVMLHEYMNWDQYSSILYVLAFLGTVFVWLQMWLKAILSSVRGRGGRRPGRES
ncbi:MAG: hypothetical protein M0Z41_08950 [Peptococcaceae bacterium]|nr:hypothetical protein [Peptococcaceae bacterium]